MGILSQRVIQETTTLQQAKVKGNLIPQELLWSSSIKICSALNPSSQKHPHPQT